MFTNKKYSISAAAMGLALFGSSLNCFAGEICFESLKPHVGINVLQMQTKFKSGYGDNLFKKSLPAGEIYAGVAINDYFGVNVGYYSSVKKNRDATLTAGDVANGLTLPAGVVTANYNATIKMSSTFIDLVGITPPLYWDSNLFVSVGIERAKTKLQSTRININNISNPQTTKFLNNKTILRFQVGASKNVVKNLKVLALIGWKNTSKIDINSTTSNGLLAETKLRNTLNYGLGLQYSFF